MSDTKSRSKKAVKTVKSLVTKHTKPKSKLAKLLPILLAIGGTIGILSAGILTVEKIHLLKNPTASLSCDLNPIVACGSVINTPQASAFGFPNPLIGLVGFGIVLAVGMAILAGAQFKRWFWQGLQAGTIFGVGFVTWLQYQSIYEIGALCPYCMVVWAVTIPIFIYTTSYNLREGNIRLPRQLSFITKVFEKYPNELLIVWFLVIVMAIIEHFWYYWSTLL